MFVDELTITAKAGKGGDGVVRWRQEKFTPKGGPAGGNGGNGGSVFVRAVSDVNRLAKYTGTKLFKAQPGVDGQGRSRHGEAGADLYIDVPVGSRITNTETGSSVHLTTLGQIEKLLAGGRGGLGNEYYKSSTNTTPMQSSQGKPGQAGTFTITVSLVVDVGLVGMPNAGKSSLLNTLTNAHSTIGNYPFTTTEPHLGAFKQHLIADIPGLIAGAAAGKGLGHKFLRHIERTKMLLHLVSLDSDDPKNDYYTILDELSNYNKTMLEKERWIILTKKDLVKQEYFENLKKEFDIFENNVFVLSLETGEGVERLSAALEKHLVHAE